MDTQYLNIDKQFWNKILTGKEHSVRFISGASTERVNCVSRQNQLSWSLSAEHSKVLIEHCKHNPLMLSVIMQALLRVVLYRLTKSSDLMIAVPAYNAIGAAANPFVMMVDEFDSRLTLRDWIKSCQQLVKSTFQHQHIKMPAKLLAQQSPLVAVYVEQMHNPENIAALSNGADLALELCISISQDNIQISCSYLPSAFATQEIAEHLPSWLDCVIDSFLANPEQPVNNIGLITDTVFDGVSASEDYPSIPDAFVAECQKHSQKIALEASGIQTCYSELQEKIDTCTGWLQARQIRKGDVVAVSLPRSEALIVTILAIWRSGAVYLPLDTELPEGRIRFMLSDSSAKLLITDCANFFDDIPQFSYKKLEEESLRNIHIDVEIAGKDTAYIIYTSGSTGKPKGTLVPHRGMSNLVAHFKENLQLDSGAKLLQFASISFDASIWELLMGLMTGGNTLCIYPEVAKTDTEFFQQYMRKTGITVATLPPPFIAQFEPTQLPDLQLLITAGSACSPKLARTWGEERQYINAYGPTETTICASMWTYNSAQLDDTDVPIGSPVLNFAVKILDQDQLPLPNGCMGEICVVGPGVANGYLHQEALTSISFITSSEGEHVLYRTGDFGYIRKDGQLSFQGRLDDQVKIRGQRIDLNEIDVLLNDHTAVEQAAILLDADVKGESKQVLCAYIKLHDQVINTAVIDNKRVKYISDYLRTQLPEYMLPSQYILMPEIPLNSQGKVDKSKLPQWQTVLARQSIKKPSTNLQFQIRAIWSEILKLEEECIPVNKSFFELGGNSLNASESAPLIHKYMGVELDLFDIFANNTIEAQEALILFKSPQQYQELPKAERKEFYPLSSAQNRLLYLHKLAPESTSYNVPGVNLLTGSIDKDRLLNAATKLTQRHASLRTQFATTPEGIKQRILDSIVPPLYFSRLEDWISGSGTQKGEIEELVAAIIKPFNIDNAPLFRIHVVTVSEEKHFLITDFHHIIADGTSIAILIRDFMKLYQGVSLPELEYGYIDYSEWQNQHLKTESYGKQEAFWLELLKEDVPRLRLPTDFQRPPIMTFEGDFVQRVLNDSTSTKLNRFAIEQNVTVFMVLLAAFNIMLQKYTHQNDITIGTGVAGRHAEELNDLVGMFINTLTLRNRTTPHESINEYLKSVKQNTLNAFKHQYVQFDDLVEKVADDRDTSRNPIFDFLIVFQNFELPEFELDNLKVTPCPQGHSTSKFDMTLFVNQNQDGRYSLMFEYYTRIFDKQTVTVFAQQLEYILEQMIATPELQIADISLFNDLEQKDWFVELERISQCTQIGNYPKVDETLTFDQIFQETAGRYPNHIAVVFDGNSYTYEQINAESNRIAHLLIKELKTVSEQPIGVIIDRSHWHIAAVLGILKAGGGYLPLESALPAERMETIVDEAQVSLVVSVAKHITRLNHLQWNCDTLEAFVVVDQSEVHEIAESSENLLGNKELWECVVERSVDDITAGGWTSSYTGQILSDEEMAEHSQNIVDKLSPLLQADMRVLEIGCSSGLSMFPLAKQVAQYVGTDISEKTIARTHELVEKAGVDNIKLYSIAALDIDSIPEANFDVIIINSVIQAFDGHNYLRQVIRKCTDKMNQKGILFLGDLLDQDTKKAYLADLKNFATTGKSSIPFTAEQLRENKRVTKTDQSSELFISRGFLKYLVEDIDGLYDAEFSAKQGKLKNELTQFRYDALLQFNTSVQSSIGERYKKQFGRESLDAMPTENINSDLTGPRDSGQLAYILFTSGSTGAPKGVMMEHRSLTSFVNAVPISLRREIGVSDSILVNSNQSFDASMFEIFLPLAFGSTCVVAQNSGYTDLINIADLIEAHRVTTAWIPAGLLPEFTKILKSKLQGSHFRNLITGAECIQKSTVDTLQQAAPQVSIMNAYGPTEGCVYATSLYIPPLDEKSQPENIGASNLTIGNVRHGASVHILDSAKNQVLPGVPGEIYIGGSGVMRGYLNNAELNAELLCKTSLTKDELLYKTGDIAKYRIDGSIDFLGRDDGQIKLRGMRIELGEIEKQVINYPAVKQAVVQVENPKDPQIVAYVVDADVNTNSGFDIEHLNQYLARHLPHYMLPTFIHHVEKIPFKVSGKIDHTALERQGNLLRAKTQNHDLSHCSPTELELLNIWSDILQLSVQSIGMKTDFFALGGHSLKATRMVAIVNRHFNITLPLAKVFQTPTIKGLAAIIECLGNTKAEIIQPIKQRAFYPLSSSQRSMYIVQNIKAGSTAYNMPGMIRMRGNLDLVKAENVINRLIDRHESLRTGFFLQDGELVQKVSPKLHYKLQVQNFTDENELESALADFIKPFDLTVAPLIRAKIFTIQDRFNEAESILFLDVNHIISDGTSMVLFMLEFSKLYNGEELAEIALQYRDFAVWQNHINDAQAIKEQEMYWKQHLEGPLPHLSLPLDFKRPEIQSFDGDHISKILSAKQSNALRKIASDNEMTLYMVMLSSAYIFLHKLTNQEDIIIGTSIAGREHAGLDQVMGMFVNTLAMRNRPLRELPLTEFFSRVRDNTIKAFDNQQVQFEQLVEMLNIPRDPSRNPIFDVRFDMHNLESPEITLEGLVVIDVEPEFKTSKFDLTFDVFERGEELEVRLEYCDKIFKPTTIKGFLNLYFKLLDTVTKNQDQRIEQIALFDNLTAASLPEIEFDF